MEKALESTIYVVCINNKEYSASLEQRKIYRTMTDQKATEHGMLRVIDESGEDYLYPEELFAPIDLPPAIIEKLSLAV